MTFKLVIPPDQASYAVTDGTEVIRVQLQGGAGRYRRDILNSSRTVNVTWTLSPNEYKYIRSFYKVSVYDTSAPFLIDLYLDEPTLTEHQARFLPGTMQLQSQSGLTFVVTAQLEVTPLPFDYSADADYIGIYNEFGESFMYWLDRLDVIVNTDLPQVF